jgi:hypothetical protein
LSTQSAEEALRRFTIGEPALLAGIADRAASPDESLRLDGRADALVRLAALIALDAPGPSYRSVVQDAMRSGVALDEIVATLAALAGTVGTARVVSAAPRVALAAGYDVEGALE